MCDSLGCEPEYWLIEIQAHVRVEAVNSYIPIVFPELECVDATFCADCKGLDANAGWIISGDKKFATWFRIRDPDFVAREKPVWLKTLIEFSVCRRRRRSR